MKIGFVFDDSLDRPDGVQQYVLTVGQWLASRGHDVHYLVSTTERTDIPNVHNLAQNIGVRFNGNRMRVPLPASRYHIRALLKKEQFDVLHVQLPYSPFLAARVIRAADERTALIGTFHIVPQSPLVTAASAVLGQWLVPTLKRFDAIYSVSPPAQTFARDIFHIDSQVLPNPIDIARFKSAEPFPLDDGRLTVLFLGRFVPRKGANVLLEATAKLQHLPDVPEFQVMLCGRGPLQVRLKEFVVEHGLDDVVQFAGFISEQDKPRYYASADVTVFPSSGGESFGIGLVEAMSSGRSAVLAGDNPGYHAILDHSPGDVLFQPTNAEELADRLAAVLKDKALRWHIATWQARHAEQFDITSIGPVLEKAYTVALQRRRNVR